MYGSIPTSSNDCEGVINKGSNNNSTNGSTSEDDEFMLTKIDTDLYLCTERYYESWNVANLYIIQGTTMDLVIDTGIGLWNLPNFLTEKGIVGGKGSDGEVKPYKAVCTHIHFDHSGGLHQFQDFAIHRDEVEAIRTTSSPFSLR